MLMRTPTNRQLNEAMGELCKVPIQTWVYMNITCKIKTLPDYCNDRNTLPELWAFLRSYQSGFGFDNYLRELCQNRPPCYAEIGVALIAPCRAHVIAALKACNAWPEEWEV